MRVCGWRVNLRLQDRVMEIAKPSTSLDLVSSSEHNNDDLCPVRPTGLSGSLRERKLPNANITATKYLEPWPVGPTVFTKKVPLAC